MPQPLDKLRVLVVEDDPALSLMVAEALAGAGAEVLGPVASRMDAVALLAHEVPDIAYVDVSLRDGTMHALADLLIAQGVPLLIASGHDPALLDPAFRGDPFLAKPFSAPTLVERLRDAHAVARTALDAPAQLGRTG